MADIVVFRPVEAVNVDPERLSQLCRECGAVEAEDVMSRAVTEIARQMTSLVRQHEGEDFDAFARGLGRLGWLAEQAGLGSLARAALAVSGCLATGDPTALAATWGRLLRLAAVAVSSGDALRGMSG